MDTYTVRYTNKHGVTATTTVHAASAEDARAVIAAHPSIIATSTDSH
jgi:hypothetical protein